MYLTLFISELPLILTSKDTIKCRVETQVTDRIVEYPVSELRSYLSSLIEVLETDVNSRVGGEPADQPPAEADPVPADPPADDGVVGNGSSNKAGGDAA